MASGFGFRSDPFTGRAALHTGLDFQANPGASIVAAAGGVVAGTEWHPQYGQLLEIDHGNGLSTRYAHTSKILVAKGDLVKRGQQVALVGNTGTIIGDVVEQVRRVTVLVGEITASSSEQNSGIGLLNSSINRLDEATQHNAALVEESTASAQNLKSSAQSLGLSVDVFKMP